MNTHHVRERLTALRGPLPRGPRALDPVVLGQLGALPDWGRGQRGRSPRDAAALVLIYPGPAEDAHLVLTERPTGGMRHSGQVSLPGGARDAGDDFPVGTALREATEEVGLDATAAGVETLGVLETVDVRVSGFMLVPVVAIAAREPVLVAQEHEVAAILRVPLRTFLPDAPVETLEEARDGYRLRYGAYRFGGYAIWGATARILGQLGAALGSE